MRFLRFILWFIPITLIPRYQETISSMQKSFFASELSFLVKNQEIYNQLTEIEKFNNQASAEFAGAFSIFNDRNEINILATVVENPDLRNKTLKQSDSLWTTGLQKFSQALSLYGKSNRLLYWLLYDYQKNISLENDSLVQQSEKVLEQADMDFKQAIVLRNTQRSNTEADIQNIVQACELEIECVCHLLSFLKTAVQSFRYTLVEKKLRLLTYRIIAAIKTEPFSKREMNEFIKTHKPAYLQIEKQNYLYLEGSFNSRRQALQYMKSHFDKPVDIVVDKGSIRIETEPATTHDADFVYRVQIAAIKDSIPGKQLSTWYQLFDTIYIDTVNNYLKCKVGTFATYQQALDFKARIKISSAFVVVDSIKRTKAK